MIDRLCQCLCVSVVFALVGATVPETVQNTDQNTVPGVLAEKTLLVTDTQTDQSISTKDEGILIMWDENVENGLAENDTNKMSLVGNATYMTSDNTITESSDSVMNMTTENVNMLITLTKHQTTSLPSETTVTTNPSDEGDPTATVSGGALTASETTVYSATSNSADSTTSGESLNSVSSTALPSQNSSDHENQTNVFTILEEDCEQNKLVREIDARQGTVVIIGSPGRLSETGAYVKKRCSFYVYLPDGTYAAVRIEDLPHVPCHEVMVNVGGYARVHDDTLSAEALRECFAGRNNLIYTDDYFVIVEFSDYAQRPHPGVPRTVLHFKALEQPGRHFLPIQHLSNTSGYVTSSASFFDDFDIASPTLSQLTSPDTQTPYATFMDAARDVILPSGHVMMVSFPLLEIGRFPSSGCSLDDDFLTLTELPAGPTEILPRKCESKVFFPRVFNTSLRLHFYSDKIFTNFGFRMLFSFHPESQRPVTVDSGLWNCSVPHYPSFQQHVHCNLELECHGGVDEHVCPFHNPPTCAGSVGTKKKCASNPECEGSLSYRDKCFKLITMATPITWFEADTACKSRGGQLAGLKTPGERETTRHFFTHGKRRVMAYVGAKLHEDRPQGSGNRLLALDRSSSGPLMYRDIWRWRDGAVAYDVNISYSKPIQQFSEPIPSLCSYLHPLYPSFLQVCLCEEAIHQADYDDGLFYEVFIDSFICEFRSETTETSPIRLSQPSVPPSPTMVTCPGGHVTHNFLSCDGMCGEGASLPWCKAENGLAFPRFACDSGAEFVHYTLVCDFRKDCRDGSDEKFCRHDTDCADHACRNGQCVRFYDWCDGSHHCADWSDERGCLKKPYPYLIYHKSSPPPSVIDLDGHGSFTQRSTPAAEFVGCPETHFQCHGEYVYCLPVYVRCNGVPDCPGHDDEANCEDYTCPGFYRCRASRVCVHPVHVCDGLSHCPQQDDEWLCGRPDNQPRNQCPAGCRCQGLAYVCGPLVSAVQLREDLRYLNASGSCLAPGELFNNAYLISLVLAECNITTLDDMFLSNLIELDLSDNLIPHLKLDVFMGLNNLRSLTLAGNPLQTITHSPSTQQHVNLHAVDLSRSLLTDFTSLPFASFPRVMTLNLSHSSTRTISAEGFQHMPYLTVLDLRGSPVEVFGRGVYSKLSYLQAVFTDNYKLCCREMLPVQFDTASCHAPADEVSSCEDLLRTDLYRVCLWLFAALSVVGNAGCFLIRFLHERTKSKTGFNTFVTNLCVADFLMGVYLMMLGSADVMYRGSYLWSETIWKSGVTCKVAGFLSLLSSEVSAFIICLITLDRFIVLRFPFSTVRFKRWSADLSCGLAWIAGIVLAGVPLLPATSEWQFYSQTGICIPLPVTRRHFAGYHYAFGVIIVLNFVLFVFVAMGQASIYWSVHSTLLSTDRDQKSRDVTVARRLITVAATDFLCWFPIGLLGLLASRGTPISGEVSVGMAIFVLPLNSALNPFLYTVNTLLEKRRQAADRRLLDWLEHNSRPSTLTSDGTRSLSFRK